MDHGGRRRRAFVSGHSGGVRLGADRSTSVLRGRCSPGRCTPIVYFWLMPAYIAFYTMVPRAAGGRLYSDTMGRLTFILFLIYCLPVGMHHLLMDPEHGDGFKFLQVLLTAFVTVPTLLDDLHDPRIDGNRRAAARRPRRVWLDRGATLGPADGARHRACVCDAGLRRLRRPHQHGVRHERHDPQHVLGHGAIFILIYGGSVVIMYFAIAYEIWPRLTGRAARCRCGLCVWQLWLWFVGMMVMTLPWHWLGLQGQWRRVANFNYDNPIIASWGPLVLVSVGGGLVLLASALLFVRNLAVLHRVSCRAPPRPLYALAVDPPQRVPAALNGFGLWNVLVLVPMLLAYGYPIAQFVIAPSPSAIVHRIE